jgi:hypothetical protein
MTPVKIRRLFGNQQQALSWYYNAEIRKKVYFVRFFQGNRTKTSPSDGEKPQNSYFVAFGDWFANKSNPYKVSIPYLIR